MARTLDYSVFGLNVRSGMALPELFPVDNLRDPDVTIRIGSLDEPETAPGLHARGEALLLTVPNVARYRIEAGREIIVEPQPAAPERNVRLYLLGSAFGALLHQRGLLPLHANAVEIDGKAVAFMGESGAGKSTLAAWFHDRGFRVIADDVCVVQFGVDGVVRACPGLPRLRLAEEVLQATGREASAFPRSYLGDEDFRKYDVAIDTNAARDASEIGAAFILAKGDGFSVEALGGVDAANAVFDHTYRGHYVDQVDGHRAHWTATITLVEKVPVFRLSRVWNIERLDEQCELILQLLKSTRPA
jgi:hypothetical protein